MTARTIRFLTLLLCLTFLTGCGISFDRKWNAAASLTSATSPSDPLNLSGRWEGSWKSEGTGHTGKLRAMLIRKEGAESAYDTLFDATWGGIFRFGTGVTLVAQKPDGDPIIRLTGQEDLGAFAGGVYTYAGEIEGDRFHTTYKSKADHGYFELRRASVKK
jgi:hypothetical protein